MADVQLIKVNGRWGTSSFTEGVKIPPRAFSEERLPETKKPPMYSSDLIDHLHSLLKEGNLREMFRTLVNRFPEWNETLEKLPPRANN